MVRKHARERVADALATHDAGETTALEKLSERKVKVNADSAPRRSRDDGKAVPAFAIEIHRVMSHLRSTLGTQARGFEAARF
jgi:hypothetical protein